MLTLKHALNVIKRHRKPREANWLVEDETGLKVTQELQRLFVPSRWLKSFYAIALPGKVWVFFFYLALQYFYLAHFRIFSFLCPFPLQHCCYSLTPERRVEFWHLQLNSWRMGVLPSLGFHGWEKRWYRCLRRMGSTIGCPQGGAFQFWANQLTCLGIGPKQSSPRTSSEAPKSPVTWPTLQNAFWSPWEGLALGNVTAFPALLPHHGLSLSFQARA